MLQLILPCEVWKGRFQKHCGGPSEVTRIWWLRWFRAFGCGGNEDSGRAGNRGRWGEHSRRL